MFEIICVSLKSYGIFFNGLWFFFYLLPSSAIFWKYSWGLFLIVSSIFSGTILELSEMNRGIVFLKCSRNYFEFISFLWPKPTRSGAISIFILSRISWFWFHLLCLIDKIIPQYGWSLRVAHGIFICSVFWHNTDGIRVQHGAKLWLTFTMDDDFVGLSSRWNGSIKSFNRHNYISINLNPH